MAAAPAELDAASRVQFRNNAGMIVQSRLLNHELVLLGCCAKSLFARMARPPTAPYSPAFPSAMHFNSPKPSLTYLILNAVQFVYLIEFQLSAASAKMGSKRTTQNGDDEIVRKPRKKVKVDKNSLAAEEVRPLVRIIKGRNK